MLNHKDPMLSNILKFFLYVCQETNIYHLLTDGSEFIEILQWICAGENDEIGIKDVLVKCCILNQHN